MKQYIKLVILCCVLGFWGMHSKAQTTTILTDNTSWQVYNGPGAPATGWQTTWPSTGWSAPALVTGCGSGLGAGYGSMIMPNWATGGTLATAYFITQFTLSSIDKVLVNNLCLGDDYVSVWINGHQIVNNYYGSGVNSVYNSNINKLFLNCGVNYLAIVVQNTQANCFFLQNKLDIIGGQIVPNVYKTLTCNDVFNFDVASYNNFPSGSTYTSVWNDGTTGNTRTFTAANSSGTYTCSTSYNGCILIKKVVLTVNTTFNYTGTISGAATTTCKDAPQTYSISNPQSLTGTAYTWTISPAGPVLTPSGNSVSIDFSTQPLNTNTTYTLSCKVDYGACSQTITYTINTSCSETCTCCDASYLPTHVFQKEITPSLSNPDPKAIYTGNNGNSNLLIGSSSNSDFCIAEISQYGNLMLGKSYSSGNNITVTDFVESVAASNGKVVIGHAANSLYVFELNPDGTPHATRKLGITFPNSTGHIVEAVSIVKTDAGYFGGVQTPYGYGVLVNKYNPTAQTNEVYLVGIPSTSWSGFWIKKINLVTTGTYSFHAHKLMPVNSSYQTTDFIILGQLTYGGNNHAGVILDTKFNCFGTGGGVTDQRISTEIYFNGCVFYDEYGTPTGMAFAGCNNATSFDKNSNIALLRTGMDLNLTGGEIRKTIQHYMFAGLGILPIGTEGHVAVMLQSGARSPHTPEYFYHSIELDANLDVPAGETLHTLNRYNCLNTHNEYVQAKTLFASAPASDAGFVMLGMGHNGVVLHKTDLDMNGGCNTQLAVKTAPFSGCQVSHGDFSTPSKSTFTFSVTANDPTFQFDCCSAGPGNQWDPCESFNTDDINIDYSTDKIEYPESETVNFNVTGTYDPDLVDHFEWFMGDGTTGSTTGTTYSHNFSTDVDQTYTNYLTVHFKNGCTKDIGHFLTVYPCGLPPVICNKTVYIPCTSTINPELHSINDFDCPNCRFEAGRAIISGWTLTAGGADWATYTKTCFDPVYCCSCIFNITIKKGTYYTASISVKGTTVVNLNGLMPCLGAHSPGYYTIQSQVQGSLVWTPVSDPSGFYVSCEGAIMPTQVFIIEATGPDGCKCRLELTIYCTGGAGSQAATKGFRIYPNPAVTWFEVERPSSAKTHASVVEIHDLYGRLLATHRMEAGELHKEIDVASIPQGVYLVTIRYGDQVEMVQKITVLRN